MTSPPLVVEGLGRRYRRGRPWAVRDLSIDFPAGSITALVGPNGAGKSTLIRACLGFERPDEGRILVAGADPMHNRRAAVEAVGYVPQDSALYRGLTIGDHLTFAQAARPGFDRTHAVERLRRLRLPETVRAGELSAGQKAQVGLALALGTRAPILLLDEPLASLDPLARREFLTILVDHVRVLGATAVLSSHIVTDVEQACDRLVVIVNGRLVLNTEIATARSEHRTVAASDLDRHTALGIFWGPSGEQLALVREKSDGQPASLEEIVLGYLAGIRE
ncbi:ABC transporter ATP-binding protein [soil metagenome]